MTTIPKGLPALKFGGPATYRVVVQGKLESAWGERLAGMSISRITGRTGEPQTSLIGPIRDQTELSGVLDTLYGLHMPIIKVEQIENET